MLDALVPLLCLLASALPAQSKPLPSFALEYAPLLWLHSNESHWPSDVSVFLEHVTPKRDGEIEMVDEFPALTDSVLSDPRLDTTDVFLTSKEDPAIVPQPAWLRSEYGKPDAKGKSAAPCFAVVVDKTGIAKQQPEGDTDVFYFTFFSFSAGLEVPVLKKVMGHHVGDWEHSMIRFKDGKPIAVYVSRHGGGTAFTYEAVEKKGKRPVFYIAKGSHATYAVQGQIDFATTGLVWDQVDRGILLDPSLNLAGFFFEPSTQSFDAADGTSLHPAVLSTKAIWGNKRLPKLDPRQSEHASFHAWADGPAGIYNKTLSRTSMGPRPQQKVETVLPVIKPHKPKSLAERREEEKELQRIGASITAEKKRQAEIRKAEEAAAGRAAAAAANERESVPKHEEL